MNIDWADLAAACGLLLVIEGLMPFASPQGARRALAAISALPDGALRAVGAASLAAGLTVLWLARG